MTSDPDPDLVFLFFDTGHPAGLRRRRRVRREPAHAGLVRLHGQPTENQLQPATPGPPRQLRWRLSFGPRTYVLSHPGKNDRRTLVRLAAFGMPDPIQDSELHCPFK